MRRQYKAVEAATHQLYATLNRNPTEIEIADKLGVDVSRLRNIVADLHKVMPVSASSRSKSHEDLPPPDLPGDGNLEPDKICARQQLRSRLNVAMGWLP